MSRVKAGQLGEIKLPHNFAESLAMSHSYSDLPIWLEIYRQAFPEMSVCVDHRQDGDHQRAGIDRSITLENSKQILIDEKVRGRNKKTGLVYEDIALEYWSDVDRKVPGWVCKPLLADYICYAIAPLGKAYLLPVPQLQSAFSSHQAEWLRNYRIIDADNKFNGRTWKTRSVCIEPPVLFKAIGECLRVRFVAMELEDENPNRS
ncbi:hypothetical protein LCGC14_2526470 [marine sediment metagenome]|uniref:Uncharacterized protein n=1 Tax=marine sediment metagenome TaxID=412755 RepID=A0A0F9BHR4_9ZZZZ